MLHKILSTIGLGVLGIDPITAIILLGMGIRKEKKYKITLFMIAFTTLSIFIGTGLAAIFGSSAVDILNSVIPSDDSHYWAELQFVISVIILIWVIYEIWEQKKTKTEVEAEKAKVVSGSWFKFIITGVVLAFTCFTDPTYYAVILLGVETQNFFAATFLLTIWFVVSQFMSFAVYFANQFGALDKLTTWLDKVKARLDGKPKRIITTVIYALLFIVGVLLLVDSACFLFSGKYLF